MEPRFIKWALLLLLLTIVTTEGLRGPASRIDGERPSAVRARGSSRFGSRSGSPSSEPPSESTTPLSPDSTTPKTSRRTAGRRAPTTSRSPTTAPPAEPTTQAAIPKSKAPSVARFSSRKLVPKVQNAEPEKNSSDNESKDRRYLPEGLSDTARTARAQGQVEGIEVPKVAAEGGSRTGGRRTARVNSEKASKPRLENAAGPSVFGGATDNSRSRTGRKIQSQSVLSSKQLKSSVPSSSRFSRDKGNEEAVAGESTTETVKNSNRRSFKHEPSDFRKKLADSRSAKQVDIAASGSESVRINIPLNFEDSRRLSGAVVDAPSTELPKRSNNSRYKSRGRQPEKKPEVESSTTSSPVSRGPSRRGGASRVTETSTEAARGRGRSQESRRSNVIADSSSTTAQPEFRRRNFNTKSVPRGFESTSRGSESKKGADVKSQNLESRKPNRPRGRYRVDVTTSAPSVVQSTLAPSGGPSVVTLGTIGNITPTFEPEVVTTPQPVTSAPAQTTVRALPQVQSANVAATLNAEMNRREDGADRRGQQNAGQRRRASKEDFFNHGLGFRGRRPFNPTGDDVPAAVTTSTTSAPAPARPDSNPPRGNPGWTLRRRPGHWHDGPASGPSGSPAEVPVDQGATSAPAPAATTVRTSGRRGNKTYPKVSGGGGSKVDEVDEGDNYPPDFKARLAQLQKAGGLPRNPSEERRLHTSSNLIGTASADLELASSDNAYVALARTASPILATTFSSTIPTFLDEQQASKMSSTELFAARSRMKLENARKLVKPELLIDETNARQVIVEPSSRPKDEADQKPSDSQVDEDQKVFKVTRKTTASTLKPQPGQKSSPKSDWKPSKLRKSFKSDQTRTSRYKQLYTPRPKLTTTSTDKSTIEETNDVEQTTKSARLGRYQEHKYKYVPKPRGTSNKIRGPKPSHDAVVQPEEQPISTTKPALAEKPRKMFTPRKNEKSTVEDIKAVALKLRKTLESMERSQTPRPARRSDSSEGSTTLLTTMRTVKSFSFSTRLVKDEGEAPISSTMKMLEDELTTTLPPSSVSPVTETVSQNPADNEVTTSGYESVLGSSNRPDDAEANEIENSSAAPSDKSSSTEPDWLALLGTGQPDFQPRAAALTNDSGSPVYVVYPSATEKPIAITPKVQKFHATIKPAESQQQSVMQEPVISVKVSSSDGNSGGVVLGTNGGADGSNIFSPVRSAAILETGNATLLEQLRSTVAPLLSTLGGKSPVFSGVYKNTNSANSIPRVTPSGAPPRFSARYRGAELFVRRPTPPTNAIVENNGKAPQIDVSSPGEPKVLTFYQAVETASINNEQTDVRQLWQPIQAAQVESTTANDPYGTNSSNSDSQPVIPVTVSSTINDISPSPTDNTMTSTPDMINILKTDTNSETTKQEEQVVVKNDFELVPTTISSTGDSPVIRNNIAATDPTTESSMSTSTESSMSTGTESSMSTGTESSMSTDTESSMSTGTESSMLTGIVSSMSASTESSMSTGTKSSMSTSSESSMSTGTKSSMPTSSESSMSTSTELITEVSVSISDNLNQSNLASTTSPTLSIGTTLSDSITSESFTTTQSVDNSLKESSTEMPLITTVLDSTEATTTTTTTTTTSTAETSVNSAELGISRTAKKLDDMNTEQPEVSNSLLDINLSTSDKGTTKPTFMEILISENPKKTTMLEILSQVKETTNNDKLNSTTENTTKQVETLVSFDILTTNQPSSQTMEETTIMPKSSQSDVLINTSITTETVPEINLNNSTEVVNTTEAISRSDLSTEMPSSTTSSTTILVDEDREKVTTTQAPSTVESMSDTSVTDSSNTSKTLDVEIQFYSAMNASTPAGTEQLTPMKNLLSNEDVQMAFEKFLQSIDPNSNITPNNLSNNSFMVELMKMIENYSLNSINTTESSINLDENNVDSSPDGLPQLLGGFLDNSNKTQSVTNDSTVETNNETTVVAQTTIPPTTTLSSEQVTNSLNTDTNTEMITQSSTSPTTQSNSDTLETTTYSPLTTISPSDNLNNNLTNVNAPLIARMMQILSKLIDAKVLAQVPIDSQTQELDSLTTNSTEAVVEDLTDNALMDVSTNIVPTTMSIETQTTPDLTTISPTMLTPFQGSTPATAQRTAGTNIQLDQTFTTLNPTINYPSSSTSSSTIVNSNDQPTKIPQSSAPAETTTNPENNSANSVYSTFSSPTAGSPAMPFNNVPRTAQPPTTTASYVGRFGTSRLTPAPKFSSSSSTTAPLRDYLIYGIYPNKTIVRKRPEDNLIDARNVDSPYVIFGIFPDGKLVRKFPNGTVIPDPPSNPVEVVFSLSTTTTTNRPRLPDNQANNQGMSNQNVDSTNNRSPVADVNTQNAFYAPNEVDNALGFSGPTGFDLINSVRSDTQQTTTTAANLVAANGSQQGGRIVADRTRDEASRTNEAKGERNSVFIGQDKFVNYWTNGQPNVPPTVLSVNINSAATASKESFPSAPQSGFNFNILPNSQSGNQVTAPPGFPWKDPLDQIFGITTNPPALTASVASNTIDDTSANAAIVSARPVNNQVEIFSPVSSTINSLINNPTKATTSSTTTTTTTPAPTTQTSTTTTTTQAPTTSPPPTTLNPITMNPNAFGTTFDDLAFLNALLEKPSPGEGTPKTLTEVEQLLANKILSLALGKTLTNGGPTRSPKAIHPSNASPNSLTGDKGDYRPTSSQPIVIDLSTTTKRPITTTPPYTWKPVRTYASFVETGTTSSSTTTTTTSTTPSTTTTSTTTTTTPRPTTTTTTTTTQRPTTRAPVIITAKPVTRRPRPTTPPPPSGPFAFAANLLQSLFGRNPFAPVTTPRPVVRRPAPTPRKVVPATTRPTTTTTTTTAASEPQIVSLQSSHTPRSIQSSNNAVDFNGQKVAIVNAVGAGDKPVEVTPRPKPASTTYSPEDDAKFLAALLELARKTDGTSGKAAASATKKPALDSDDEAFLRSILNGQAKIQPLSTAGGNDKNDAALLAAFLKAQGIEPSTPSNSLLQQLQQQPSHGKTTAKTTSTTVRLTSTTTRRTTTQRRRPPSSTYPPPLFSNFGGSAGGGDQGTVRSQVVNAAIGVTRAFGQFLGAAITGAAQQFQSFVRNGTLGWGR